MHVSLNGVFKIQVITPLKYQLVNNAFFYWFNEVSNRVH